MGNKLAMESQPPIRGSNPKIDIEDLPFFNRVRNILRNNYINNKYNDNNLNNSLEKKSFKSNPVHPQDIDDITWLDYIINYLRDTTDNYHYTWCTELLFFIKKQSFLSENKYDSIFFYNEFLIQTNPEILIDSQDIDNDENIIDIDKLEQAYNTGFIGLDELDITANLGGVIFGIKHR